VIKTKLDLFIFLILLFMLCTFYVNRVYAAEVRIGITPATENTDGSAIPASGPLALNRTSIGWWVCGESDAVNDVNWTDVTPQQTSATITYPDDAGTYCFRGAHRNNAGEWSGPSNVVQKTIIVIPPVIVPPGEDATPNAPIIIIIVQ
jgi:hypothetical protein